MRGFVDLHCHWIHEIDDGARDVEESRAILQGLHRIGFSHVVATPHTRPGMFDNDAPGLRVAYHRTRKALADDAGLPETSLASEHFFDELVVNRVLRGEALPYRKGAPDPGEQLREGGSLLLEFHDLSPFSIIGRQLFELRRSGYLVVVAHPERYRAVWSRPQLVKELIDQGAVTLLDTAALVGKYGRRAQTAAQALLEEGWYHAACSDVHRPSDVEQVQQGIEYIDHKYGQEELELLFISNPQLLLEGRRPEL